MSESSTIHVRVGQLELTCSEEAFEDVLRGLKAQLPGVFGDRDAPSLATLLETSSAKSFGDKAGVVAWWLEEHRGRRQWRSGEIVEALRDIGEALPANITDALNQKQRKGLFHVEDRRWSLTEKGRGWVEYGLLRRIDD